jgi:hypothetical protein
MERGSVGAVLVAVSVLVLSIGALVAIVWTSRKAKPLGNLPYRWGLFLGVANAIGAPICLWFALSAFFEGTLSERSVLCVESVLGAVAGVGLCRRERWGVVVWIADESISFLPALLKATYEAANGHQEAKSVLALGILALVLLIVNIIYFKKRWRLMGTDPIPVIPEPVAETASSNNITHKKRQFDSSLAGRRLRTLDDALQVYQSCDFNSPVVAQLPRGAEIQLGAASEFEGREWLEATLLDGSTGYVLGPSARSHTEVSN